MTPKIRNIIIFTGIAAIFVFIYIFFIKPSPEEPSLVSSPSGTALPNIDGSPATANIPNDISATVNEDFLALLSSVKNITLDDSIFSDPAFSSLRDSSITLIPDGTEGRPNPFAQFGSDNIIAPVVIP